MKRSNDGPALITMTTDFGSVDGFAGTVKGVILGIAPKARIIDLSHEVAPGDIAAASWILKTSWSYFPPGSIHLAVVDPGVGGSRRPLIIEAETAAFIGPDNGIFSFLYSGGLKVKAYELENDRYRLSPVSATFHARDIFGPAAAHLTIGVSAGELGAEIEVGGLVRLPALELLTAEDGIHGRVEYVDRFGNLITNIPSDAPPAGAVCFVEGRQAGHLRRSYASVAAGEPVVVAGSHGVLEIAVNRGRACEFFACGAGAAVRVLPSPARGGQI